MKDLLILAIFPAAMTLTAVTDLFTLTVSNRTVIALAVLFFVAAPFASLGLTDIGFHACLALVALRSASPSSPWASSAVATPSCLRRPVSG